jgi:hypothetical protein
LELRIVNYQFRTLKDQLMGREITDDHDANWLDIEISACARGRSWKTIEPCLLTWEVERLAKWLEGLAEGGTQEIEPEFVEPVLRFVVADHPSVRRRLRVYFELESRPSWAPSKGYPNEDFWIELEGGPDELRSWAADLRQQLARFPIRHVQGEDGQSQPERE